MKYLKELNHTMQIKNDRLKVLLVACKRAITRKWYKLIWQMQDDWLKIGRNGLLIHQQQDNEFQIDAYIEKTMAVTIITSLNCEINP